MHTKAGQADVILGPDIQVEIGHALRAIYDDIVKQGVPDRFATLVRRLDTREGADNRETSGKSETEKGRNER
jgi:hypothetical protein